MLLKDMQPCCSPAFNHATAPTAQQVRSQEEARLMKSVVSRVHLILDGCQDLTETPQAHASLGVGLRVGVGVGFGGTEESMVLGGGFVSEKQTLEKRVDGLVALLRAQRGQIDALNANPTEVDALAENDAGMTSLLHAIAAATTVSSTSAGGAPVTTIYSEDVTALLSRMTAASVGSSEQLQLKFVPLVLEALRLLPDSATDKINFLQALLTQTGVKLATVNRLVGEYTTVVATADLEAEG